MSSLESSPPDMPDVRPDAAALGRVIAPLLATYIAAQPDEQDRLARFQSLVNETAEPERLVSRHNFVGHVTASGFVLNARHDRLLLIYHNGLQMSVQPGGHLEAGDVTPLAGARREVEEETGIISLAYRPAYAETLVPFDIDSHYIPPNPTKAEPEHWHHDFRYVFVCADPTQVVTDDREVSNARWVALDVLHKLPTFEHVGAKLVKFLRVECGTRSRGRDRAR